MPKCSKCQNSKLAGEFNFRNKALNLRQKSCRSCTQLEIRSHYQKNKLYYLEKAKVRNNEHRKILKEYVWGYLLEHPCVDCGETDPIVLDFDHQGGKIANVSDIIKNRSSLEVVKREIKKCKVRCANCHRRKTAHDFGWYQGNMPA